MKIEKTEIWLLIDNNLQLKDGGSIRGFFGNIYRNISEFHGHIGDHLIYKHPLIQYKVINKKILIIGLKEGAYLLKALPNYKYIEIHHKNYSVYDQNKNNNFFDFGITKNIITYEFITHWIGLNEKNYKIYIKCKKEQKNVNLFLSNILIGNILSMSKSLGYIVKEKINLTTQLEEKDLIEVKSGIKLLAFNGKIKINFSIPELWGIGKFSSKGYGTVITNNGGKSL